MSTTASHSHDALERIQDRLDQLRAESERMEAKLTSEISAIDRELLLADCLNALRIVNTRNLSEGQRAQISGVKIRLREAMRA